MSARDSRFGAFSSRSGRGTAAGAVIACAAMLLAGCGGSAADGAAPVIRGDAASVAQDALSVSNTALTNHVDVVNIALTTSGGSGTGDVTFTVLGTGCSLNVGTSLNVETSLTATDAGTCIVWATKAASTGWIEAISAQKTFTFTTGTVDQATLGVYYTGGAAVVGNALTMNTSGGSGTGAVTFNVKTNGNCVRTATTLRATRAGECGAYAVKAASPGYLAAQSSVHYITFRDAAQETLTVSNTPLTGTIGTAIALTTSGGSGTGAVTFAATGSGCSVSGTSLDATAAVACIVTAKKAAATGFLAATSAATTFTFTAPVAQATLSVSNTVLTSVDGEEFTLTSSGGSGTGDGTFTVTGTGCSVSGTRLNANTLPATCIVTAKKAASTGYLEATSETKTFTFLAAQAVLRVSNETLTTSVGTAIVLTTSGGSGTGAVTFKVKGWGCLFDAKDRLIATGATVCIVTAKKAASTGYQATESESKTFTYTKK